MKKIKIFAIASVALMVAGFTSSCVNDLNVTPIDPNTVLPEEVLSTEEAFNQLLAKCYQGLCSSSSYGQDGGPDIDGVDGGYGQYFRAVVNLQELTTDVMTCCWNDGTLFDLHNLCWTPSNEFVFSMYMRIYFQIGQCNEFIRRSEASEINGYPKKNNYIAEARALRLLSYYHAIDMFGNVPFATEEGSVGSEAPVQISRGDLFNWMVDEAKDLLASNDLAEAGKAEYGRADKGLVMMILAKLYLNAQVWSEDKAPKYAECAQLCEQIINTYPLHTNYSDLFCADNHRCVKCATYNGDEIIFAAPQDGIQLCSYGSTNFLVFASTWSVAGNAGKTMDVATVGISSGWSGLSLTGALTSKFEDGDARAMFFKGDYKQYIPEIRDSDGASEGWKSMKFSNINHDGTSAQAQGFVDTDFPVFRSADAYLMYAECALLGGLNAATGRSYLNAVRHRAGLDDIDLTLENVIDERARELYLEGHRRQDLVRFGLFTSSDYLWEFKGGVADGKGVDSHFNLFSIPADDLNANGNLVQNEGY